MTRARSSFFGRLGTLLTGGLLIAACLLPNGAAAQYQNPGPPSQPDAPTPGTSATRPRFSVDATLQFGEGGRPIVRLDYRLSRTEILFERTPPAGYRAAYEVRVIFYRAKGKRQITGDTYNRELRVASYSETRVRGEDISDHLDFRIPPGKYKIEVAITDIVAERTSGTAIEFQVPDAPPGLVWFSDLSLGTSEPGADQAGGAPAFRPNPSRRFGENITTFAVSSEIVDQRNPAGLDSAYRVSYAVVSDTGERIVRGDATLIRRGARTPFVLRPKVANVGAGSYRFVVELAVPPEPSGKSRKASVVRRDKSFEVDESRITMGFASAQSLDVLRYIATQQEIDEIGRLEGEDARKAFWEAFWKRRDPTPDTPENEAQAEFYQRVHYANQHFSTGTPGWKSDMGRIYIIFGRPDEVERHPFNFDRPPEEIWRYLREQRTFVFVDRDGFGRYELVVSPAGP